jgi:hypothetical protein
MDHPELECLRKCARFAFAVMKILELPVCLIILFLLPAGCAAPGAPIARQPAVAQGVNDLAAQQKGTSVVLTFTLPKETVQGQPLAKLPQIEVYRQFLASAVTAGQAAQPPAPEQLIFTVAPQTEAQYQDGNRLRIPTPLADSDVAAHFGENAVYMVRTRISARESGDSNLAEVRILPAPAPIDDMHAQVTESSIALSWTAVEAPVTHTLGTAAIRYRVYRAQDSAVKSSAVSAGGTAQDTSALAYTLLGETVSPAFNDAKFTFGLRYEYTVQSVAHYDAGEVESEESKPLVVLPQDTFPPAAPEGLVGALVLANGGEAPHVDLSWAISPETDLAGYNVYRREAESESWSRVNSQSLLTPVFRDMSMVSGRRYLYRVTAVDRSGNESIPSAAVAVTLPGPNEQEK